MITCPVSGGSNRFGAMMAKDESGFSGPGGGVISPQKSSLTDVVDPGTVLQSKIEGFNETVRPQGWRMEVNLVATSPVFETGLKYLSTGQDLLLPLCLNNGYYDRENIYRMLQFAASFSNHVQVFTTEGPARRNEMAKDKPPGEAIAKAHLGGNKLRNFYAQSLDPKDKTTPLVAKAFSCLDYQETVQEKKARKKLSKERSLEDSSWKFIYRDKAYIRSRKELRTLYYRSSAFQNDVRANTEYVLLKRFNLTALRPKQLALGARYVLEELAMILSYIRLGPEAKPLQDHGSNGFNYIYNESWPVFENLMNGVYDGQPRQQIGFVIAELNPKDSKMGETLLA